MQISEKSIKDTIAYLVAVCRRESSECHTVFVLDDNYWHTRSKLDGLRVLFMDHSRIIALLDAAMLETDEIWANGKARLSARQSAA